MCPFVPNGTSAFWLFTQVQAMKKLSQNPRREKNCGTWGGLEATASRFRRNKRSQFPAPVLCQTRCLSGRETSDLLSLRDPDVLRPGHPSKIVAPRVARFWSVSRF